MTGEPLPHHPDDTPDGGGRPPRTSAAVWAVFAVTGLIGVATPIAVMLAAGGPMSVAALFAVFPLAAAVAGLVIVLRSRVRAEGTRR